MKSVQLPSTLVAPAGRQCPRCGAKLGGFGPEGLCGACLIGAGLGEDDPAPTVEPLLAGPRRFGEYELLEEIARGGMGVVFKARQISLNRIVAVKMILSGQLAGAADVQRFRREAEAAAHLHHSNIVAIHEVGESDGQHYFSMDYVEGRSLSALVRDGPLPAPVAARYVEKIARAVHYAHEQGVLHRDLKPSNVLLDHHDEPQVTDFGLAKRLNAGSETQNPELTLSGQALGTPAFMPPEQATGQRNQMGPRSDVYSLGAILYHLLTGRPPFVGADAHATLAQVLGSEVVLPRLLNPAVPTDLETIALKCLEKEPARRYASAQTLAEDLARHLRHEPIQAVPPGPIYRARKFVRRHRVGVAVAAGILLLLATATAVSTVFGLRANRERIAALNAKAGTEKAEGEARRKADEANAVLNFLRDHVFAAARPEGRLGGLGTGVTLKQALDMAEPQIAGIFKGQSNVILQIRNALGSTYLYLGDHANAIRQFEHALSLATTRYGPDHTNIMTHLHCLAEAYRKSARWSEALPLGRREIEIGRAKLGRETRDTLSAINGLALIYLDMGNFTNATSLLQEALGTGTARRTPTNDLTISLSHNLALAWNKAGRFPEAIALLEEVVARRTDSIGRNHPNTLQSMNTLGQTYRRVHRLEDAVRILNETMERRMNVLGPDHPDTLESVYSLSGAYRENNQIEDALPLAERALAGRRARLGADHPDTLYAMNNLAATYQKARRLTEAVALNEELRSLQEARFGRDHEITLTSMQNLAVAYVDVGRLSEAVPLFETTLSLRKGRLGPAHSDTLLTMSCLGTAYQRAGRSNEATALLQQALALSRVHLGRGDRITREILNSLASACLATNGFVEAKSLLRELESGERQALAADSLTLAATRSQLADCLLRQGGFAEAEPILRECLGVLEKTQPGLSPTFIAQSLLGWALLGQKRFGEAEPLLLQSFEGLTKRQTGKPSRSRAQSLKEIAEHLAQLYEARGNSDEATKWREKLR